MRPLFHPAVEDLTVEGILHALSDPVRAAIHAAVVRSTAAVSCCDFLTVADRPVPKSTLSQHFKVLREAGLIRSERCGVEMRNTSRRAEVDRRFPGLITAIVNAHLCQCETGRGSSRARRITKP